MMTMDQFGEYLRREREMRGISLDEVSGETKISKTLLESLEAGKVETLPPVTFVKGFLKAYSNYVGLDPNDVVLRFESALLGKKGMKFRNGGLRIPFRLIGKVLLVALSLGVAYLVASLYVNDITYKAKKRTSPAGIGTTGGQQKESEEEMRKRLIRELGIRDLVERVGKPVAEMPQIQPTPKEEPAVSGDEHSLNLTAKEDTWVRVAADDGKETEVMIKKGDTREFKAKEGFKLRVGNAGGVAVEYNGEDLGPLGGNGEPVNIEIPGIPPEED